MAINGGLKSTGSFEGCGLTVLSGLTQRLVD
ncbi:hypothetical protein COLO4_17787 [Corchorus olitorius]|uniref:Uncharacterized protein n=1 Tax=Corchorus olitorius TaxID=93759 RepID=A0A1R3JBH5_9ROSI|nr:hypothetical protein COLO4_17787 [Corchorus olitorius]